MKPVIRVNWLGLPKGYYVRRITRNGAVSGHLTDRGGWGNPHIAQVFETVDLAGAAAQAAGARLWEVLDNTRKGGGL